jgi:signal transduction histidine kinase/DNA-binding response OmpR family regulator
VPTLAPSPGDEESRRRFNVAGQSTRLAVYCIAAGLATLSRASGYMPANVYAGLTVLAAGAASAVLFRALFARGILRAARLDLTALPPACDTAIITCAIYVTGGLGSPWFIWYLSNTAAAAFRGPRHALVIAGANMVAYLGMLAWMGQIYFWNDGLWLAVTQMTFLYGASFFFLRGVMSLQQKRQLVRLLQREQEQRLEQLISMTQDLDQGTRALAEANIQIREADRMKSQFLANMSHELRTPLNSIIGFSEILLDRLVGEIPTKYVKFLRNIHSSGQHLLGIINDILDLSKVEAGKMDVHSEMFRVPALIEGVLNVMHGMASKQRINFAVDAPDSLPPIEADSAKFKQILYNLLSNAVKFSPEQATVWVTARELGPDESPLGVDALTVSVTDKGIGIAPAEHELIFQEFHQVDGSATRQFGGTGLGLALVKKFTELQGGLITVASEPGRGSTFSITLPLRPRSPDEPPAVLELDRAVLPGDNRVLVVEDDIVAFQSISRSLSGAGYLPIRARHGEEALLLARRLRPTAITLDIALPGASGLEVLKALKKDPVTKSIPVVIISMLDNRELGLTLGADDYFVKPVDRERLVSRLQEIAPPGVPSRRSALLLVDDDPAVHELLEAELGQLGYTLEHAFSGIEGIERVRRQRPDAVILDLMMPDVTGFEVAAALKDRTETARVPIVVLTARDLSDEERSRLSGKIAALIPKGRSAPSRLVAAIRDLESRAQEVARVR